MNKMSETSFYLLHSYTEKPHRHGCSFTADPRHFLRSSFHLRRRPTEIATRTIEGAGGRTPLLLLPPSPRSSTTFFVLHREPAPTAAPSPGIRATACFCPALPAPHWRLLLTTQQHRLAIQSRHRLPRVAPSTWLDQEVLDYKRKIY